jgi:hypothetical protein
VRRRGKSGISLRRSDSHDRNDKSGQLMKARECGSVSEIAPRIKAKAAIVGVTLKKVKYRVDRSATRCSEAFYDKRTSPGTLSKT